jgi:hypothetical protein
VKDFETLQKKHTMSKIAHVSSLKYNFFPKTQSYFSGQRLPKGHQKAGERLRHSSEETYQGKAGSSGQPMQEH